MRQPLTLWYTQPAARWTDALLLAMAAWEQWFLEETRARSPITES